MNHWICAPEFLPLKPIDHFCRELEQGSEPETNLRNKHILFRKTFQVKDVNRSYRLRITADDYYKLWINGQYVGQGPADAYAMHYQYNEYDVTDMLHSGDNVICVHNYYHGFVQNRWFTSGDFRQGIWLTLMEDDVPLLTTDESWHCLTDPSYDDGGNIMGYQTQFTENRDCRIGVGNWIAPDYEDSHWPFAAVKAEDDHVLEAQPVQHVVRYEVKPMKITAFQPGHFLMDLGKETVGCLSFCGSGQNGSRVEVRSGEELEKDGHVRYAMRCNVTYQEFWTLSGGVDRLESYAYKGFRYVEIIADDAAVTPDQFTVWAQHAPLLPRKKDFHCSDAEIQKIWDICENAVIIATQEAFVDCPTREKGQYLGDLLITGQAHSILTGNGAYYQKALIDFAHTDFITKGLLAVAPGSLMQEIADFSLLFPYQVVKCYHITGDRRFLEEMLPVVTGILEEFRQYERPDGLLSNVKESWNLVDWPENLRDGYDFPLERIAGDGTHNVINAYYYGAKKYCNEICALLGQPPRYDLTAQLSAFRAAFYAEQTGLFTDSEITAHSSLHANALPLFFGMVSEDEAAPVVHFLQEKGLCCGVFFSYFVLKGIAQYGYHREMDELLCNRSEHSWFQMLSEGATACFEAWGKDQKRNTSLCHPWGASPILLITEEWMGLRFCHGKLKQEAAYPPEHLTFSLQ